MRNARVVRKEMSRKWFSDRLVSNGCDGEHISCVNVNYVFTSHAHAALLPHQEYADWKLMSARRAVAFGGCRHRRCGCVRSGATYNNGGTPSTSDNTRTATWKCAAGMRSFHPGTAAELGSKLCSGGRPLGRDAAFRGLTRLDVDKGEP